MSSRSAALDRAWMVGSLRRREPTLHADIPAPSASEILLACVPTVSSSRFSVFAHLSAPSARLSLRSITSEWLGEHNALMQDLIDLNRLRSSWWSRSSVVHPSASHSTSPSAVSAACAGSSAIGRRVARAVAGDPTNRGEQLLEQAKPHLSALLIGALSPPSFDAKTSDVPALWPAYASMLAVARLLQTGVRAPEMRVIALRFSSHRASSSRCAA